MPSDGGHLIGFGHAQVDGQHRHREPPGELGGAQLRQQRFDHVVGARHRAERPAGRGPVAGLCQPGVFAGEHDRWEAPEQQHERQDQRALTGEDAEVADAGERHAEGDHAEQGEHDYGVVSMSLGALASRRQLKMPTKSSAVISSAGSSVASPLASVSSGRVMVRNVA